MDGSRATWWMQKEPVFDPVEIGWLGAPRASFQHWADAVSAQGCQGPCLGSTIPRAGLESSLDPPSLSNAPAPEPGKPEGLGIAWSLGFTPPPRVELSPCLGCAMVILPWVPDGP